MAEDDHDCPTDSDYSPTLWAEGWRPMDHPPHNEEVEAHIERCFGKTQTVLHEMLSLHVHIDVNVIPPEGERRFTTYVTSGMSDLPMTTPEGMSKWSRLELVLAIPGPPEAHRSANGGAHYLVREMISLARYPHATGSWLFYQHSIGATEGAGAYYGPDTAMGAALIAMPVVAPIVEVLDAFELTLSTGETVLFCGLVPLHADELAFKLEHGAEALMQRLDKAGVTEVWDPGRPSVLAAPPRPSRLRRWLGGG